MTATEIVIKWSAQGTPDPSGNKMQQGPNILQNGITKPPVCSFQLEHKWEKTRAQLKHKWNTHSRIGTHEIQVGHKWNNWYMHHTWRRHLRMSSYKLESPDPQSTEWIAGNSPLFSRRLQLEHKWEKTRAQLEHKWNTHPRSGTHEIQAGDK